MHLFRRVLTLLFFCCLSARAAGEPVVIDDSGQGFAFSHRGNCYVMLPEHLLGPPGRIRRFFSAQTAVPPLIGGGMVVYEPGSDLVLGHLTGDIETRCAPRLRDLPGDVSELLRTNTTGELVWIAGSGLLKRTPLSINVVEFDYFYAKPADGTGRDGGFQGQSGSIVFVNGTPAGMALEAETGADMTFMRMDTIVDRIDRFLRQDKLPRPALESMSEEKSFRVTAWSPELEDSALGALTGAGGSEARYRASLEDGPVILEITFTGDEAIAVERIELSGGDPDGGAVPQAIRVDVDSATGAERRWRLFGAGDMSPGGQFEVFRGGGTWARRVRIQIESAWGGESEVSVGPIRVK